MLLMYCLRSRKLSAPSGRRIGIAPPPGVTPVTWAFEVTAPAAAASTAPAALVSRVLRLNPPRCSAGSGALPSDGSGSLGTIDMLHLTG